MFTISCIISLLFITVSVLEASELFVLVFISNLYIYIFWMWTFHVHYNVYRTRTFLQDYSKFSYTSIVKMWIRDLWILHFGVYFSSKTVLQGLSKINLSENKSMPKSKWHEKMQQLENVQSRKCFRGYCNKLQNQITN